MSLVSFVKAQGMQTSSLKRAISDSLDLVGYEFPRNVRNIVIKPNMCYYWDHTTGQTTNPNFVASLIDVVREQLSSDVNISVVESDASAMRCAKAFRILGYEKLAKHKHVNLVNLSEDSGEKVDVAVRDRSFHFTLPQTIQTADLRINIPKIKFMPQTKISCALKNIYGCNPYPNKFRYHPKLDEVIVALNKIMGFSICILDGTIVSGSHPQRLDLVMASQDPVAFDSAAAQLTGVNPKSVRHITLASKEGLGNTRFITKGADPTLFANRFPKEKSVDKIMSSLYTIAIRSGLLKTDVI